ncbi:hypothetical protein Tsubulata_011299, partial [Turnera subulata]
MDVELPRLPMPPPPASGTSEAREQADTAHTPNQQNRAETATGEQGKTIVISRKERSKAWDYFNKIENPSGTRIGKCKRCGQEFRADSKKNGTS